MRNKHLDCGLEAEVFMQEPTRRHICLWLWGQNRSPLPHLYMEIAVLLSFSPPSVTWLDMATCSQPHAVTPCNIVRHVEESTAICACNKRPNDPCVSANTGNWTEIPRKKPIRAALVLEILRRRVKVLQTSVMLLWATFDFFEDCSLLTPCLTKHFCDYQTLKCILSKPLASRYTKAKNVTRYHPRPIASSNLYFWCANVHQVSWGTTLFCYH